MNVLKLTPIYISAIIMTAHFFRLEQYFIVIICICFPFLLFFKTKLAARLIQIILLLGAIEWIRTIIIIVNERITNGEPCLRLVIILGIVTLFTGFSSFIFKIKSLKERYKL